MRTKLSKLLPLQHNTEFSLSFEGANSICVMNTPSLCQEFDGFKCSFGIHATCHLGEHLYYRPRHLFGGVKLYRACVSSLCDGCFGPLAVHRLAAYDDGFGAFVQ